jgi:hypothetical protein
MTAVVVKLVEWTVNGITMLRDTKLVELMDSTFTTDLADNSDALMETASTTHLGVRLVALMVNAFTAPQALKWAELKARGFMTHQVVKSAELMDCEECKSSFTFISSCKPNMILVLSS